MSKHKSSPLLHQSSPPNPSPGSNAQATHPHPNSTSNHGSHNLPQHIYYTPDPRRETSSASLTPPTTISMPIPPLPQRQHASSSTSPAITGLGISTSQPSSASHSSNSTHRDSTSHTHRGRELRDRDFRSFSYNSPDYQDNPLPSNTISNIPNTHNTNTYNLHQSMVSNSPPIGFLQSATSHASAAATERFANHPNPSSRSSSSGSQTSLPPYQISHSAQGSNATLVSSSSSVRAPSHISEKKSKNLMSRASMASIQSSSTIRNSIYDDTLSIAPSSKKTEQITIQRPKDDKEVDRMFVELMVC